MRTKGRGTVIEAGPVNVVQADQYISRMVYHHLQEVLTALEQDAAEGSKHLGEQFEGIRRDMAPFTAAFEDKSRLDISLNDLKSFLKTAKIIEDQPEYINLPDGQIWYGTLVTYHELGHEDELEHVALLNSRERQIMSTEQGKGRWNLFRETVKGDHIDPCSNVSEFGQVLIGHFQGDIVDFRGRHLKVDAVTKAFH